MHSQKKKIQIREILSINIVDNLLVKGLKVRCEKYTPLTGHVDFQSLLRKNTGNAFNNYIFICENHKMAI